MCSRGISIIKNTLPGKNYAGVNFGEIKVTDNSGEPVKITCLNNDTECHYKMDGEMHKVPIATELTVKFKATDSSGNSAYCIFKVTVKGKFILGL